MLRDQINRQTTTMSGRSKKTSKQHTITDKDGRGYWKRRSSMMTPKKSNSADVRRASTETTVKIPDSLKRMKKL